MAKKKKTRVELRKNRTKPPRPNQWTQGFERNDNQDATGPADERIRAKGDISRKRTIMQDEATAIGDFMPAIDHEKWVQGRVLRCHGLDSVVMTEAGAIWRCKVRRLLKSLTTDERNIVTTGDHVWFSPSLNDGGFIERIEPRHGLLTRASKGREHILVANVDQVVIVVALKEPDLKPHLIDRYLASAEQGGIEPIICLNKSDLIDPVEVQPLIGYYSQLGILTLLTSVRTGQGLDRLRHRLVNRESVFSGQSGVGKSSLLNAIQPGLGLQVRTVSETTQKGRHTTTNAQLLQLEFGGWVVDTPGIRQFELWDLRPEEMEGFFPEFRPYVPLCAFPDCTHTHEERCAVKDAVARRHITEQRYISYLGLAEGIGEDVREE